MVIAKDDLASLGAAPRLATCPACTAFTKTVYAQEKLSMRAKTLLGFKVFFSLGLVLLWHRKTPHTAWFTHYCGSCGLRLVLCDDLGNRNYIEPSQLVELRSADGVARKVAPSPYRPDSIMAKDVAGIASRYRHLQPTAAFSVQFGSTDGVPSVIRRIKGTREVYTVACPDLDWDNKFHVDFLMPTIPKHKKNRLIQTVWSPTTPSIIVHCSSGRQEPRVAGLLQLAQQRWDTKLYFPAETTDRDASPKYESRLIGICDEYIFNPYFPCMLWQSSKGHLLWTSRLVNDGTGTAGALRKHLVLLDSYDRLVAMEIDNESRTSRQLMQTTSPPRPPALPRNLYVYGDLERPLVEEILISYVAVLAQIYRKVQVEYELLMETQES
ncbi:hypothetical protein NLG97_g1101 [Lecanicillium saksenae]|uniref:Uncharacterized protein n=1 Tax=Lecanicillium saksenae TaxID=468837 RepID=A0ACC1R6L9_9HYPO|nr:hypothetical protein NLG97_g1101 [Lecanicillium saksenae]